MLKCVDDIINILGCLRDAGEVSKRIVYRIGRALDFIGRTLPIV